MTMLRRLRASGDPEPDRRCSFPGCARAALLGDGPLTPCWPHVLQLGHAAADPSHLTRGEQLLLLEAHGDVVDLIEKHDPNAPDGRQMYTQYWLWKSQASETTPPTD